ncbi:hypothetical protein [Radiobacillus deserti]|uniref:Uncharacterized protein n=1 Tax=Radiobacillus deserti TaxID=2594883 RepID=A0A516KHV8_9BACI|nr:hypothetical protein [Radiobacillus deserti]QDP40984.1 hypothetical protein FN924_12775 [Radiobacillus deserti]
MKKRLYWMLPFILVFIGLGILFTRNLLHVTEPPESDWSRDLELFETDINQQPIVTFRNNEFQISSYNTNAELIQKSYNKHIELTNTSSYDIPYTKWTRVFIKDEQVIYFDYKNIYDGENKELIDQANHFYPLRDTILYMKGSDLYQLHPETLESTEVISFKDKTDEIVPFQQGDSIWFIVPQSGVNSIQLDVYQLQENKAKLMVQPTFTLKPGELLSELSFATDGKKAAFLYETKGENTGGTAPVYTTYLAEGNLKDATIEPRRITYSDPHSSQSLKEIGDSILTYKDGTLVALFAASGFSQTKHGETSAFNIYTATFNGEEVKVERRSNTSAVSSKPQWVDDRSITWLDLDGDHYKLLYASSNPEIIEKAKQITGDNVMAALGKTLLMVASSFFGYVLTSIWFIWPLLFLVVLFLIRKRLLDQDPVWLFYSGIGIYILAAIIYKDRFFIDSMYERAPDFLTFPGSSYLYIFGFGLLAYLFSWMGYKVKEWSSIVRLFFFIIFHLLLLVTYFGPYLL